jgi:hypothetical protein
MTKDQKIKVLQLVEDGVPIKQAIQMERDPKMFLLIDTDGVETCEDPDYPDNVQSFDHVIKMHIYTDAEIAEYHKSIGFSNNQ